MRSTQKTPKKHQKESVSINDGQVPIKALKRATESRTEREEETAQEPVVRAPESGSEDESDDDEGIDEEGMEKLMAALGEDGLDEFAQVELNALAGGSGDEESEADSEEEIGSGSEGLGSEGAFDIQDEEEDEDETEETQNDIPLDEVESVDEDVVLKQKVEIDNKIALERIRETIKLDASMPWTETLTVTYPQNIEVDVDDDLNRELAFYKQALHAATTAKSLASKHNLPFTRPSDYFAEMVKSDAHMERIRQRLLDEGATIKRSEDKRKEREGKKFGKQIQMEKLKERERSKKDLEERLKGLKRKRKGALDNPEEDDGAFDVAVEDAISDRPSKRTRGALPGKRGLSRQARDSKFGFGSAHGRRSKQNTTASTDNFEPRGSRNFRGGRGGSRGGARGSAREGSRGGARGGSKRPGKNRRMATRGRS